MSEKIRPHAFDNVPLQDNRTTREISVHLGVSFPAFTSEQISEGLAGMDLWPIDGGGEGERVTVCTTILTLPSGAKMDLGLYYYGPDEIQAPFISAPYGERRTGWNMRVGKRGEIHLASAPLVFDISENDANRDDAGSGLSKNLTVPYSVKLPEIENVLEGAYRTDSKGDITEYEFTEVRQEQDGSEQAYLARLLLPGEQEILEGIDVTLDVPSEEEE